MPGTSHDEHLRFLEMRDGAGVLELPE